MSGQTLLRSIRLTKFCRFFIAADDAASGERQQREISAALLNSPESADKIGHFFGETTRNLIASSSFTLVGGKTRGVDLVRDVLKHVPVHWVATEIVMSFYLGCCYTSNSHSVAGWYKNQDQGYPTWHLHRTPVVRNAWRHLFVSIILDRSKFSFDMFGRFIFLDVEAAKVMVLEERVKGYVQSLLRHIKSNLVVNAGQRVKSSSLFR